jgi:hypothetical protein
MAGIFESHFSNTVKFIPLLNLGQTANEGLENAFEMNKLMIELTNQIKTLTADLKADQDEYARLLAARDALHKCLVKAAAASGDPIIFADGVDPSTALSMSEALSAPVETSAAVNMAKLAPGFYLAFGTAAADVVFADTKFAPEADATVGFFGEQGDDRFYVAQGNAYIDGGTGSDIAVVLSTAGAKANISATRGGRRRQQGDNQRR